jgi:hypothetical protein
MPATGMEGPMSRKSQFKEWQIIAALKEVDGGSKRRFQFGDVEVVRARQVLEWA